jgi:hypothetical protein
MPEAATDRQTQADATVFPPYQSPALPHQSRLVASDPSHVHTWWAWPANSPDPWVEAVFQDTEFYLAPMPSALETSSHIGGPALGHAWAADTAYFNGNIYGQHVGTRGS